MIDVQVVRRVTLQMCSLQRILLGGTGRSLSFPFSLGLLLTAYKSCNSLILLQVLSYNDIQSYRRFLSFNVLHLLALIYFLRSCNSSCVLFLFLTLRMPFQYWGFFVLFCFLPLVIKTFNYHSLFS